MRVLVTGGTGFVGSSIVEKLRTMGQDVTVLSRGIHNRTIPGVKYIQKNITDIDREVINADVIIHCASTINDYNLLYSACDDIEYNLRGTWKLLESCRQFNPWAKVVYISTFFVNGDPDELPATEKTIERPKGLYGITKKASEDLCKTYANVFDLNTVIVRLSNIYGPNQYVSSQKTAAFNWMAQQCVKNGEIPLYDNGDVRRDYLYIDDAVDAILTVAINTTFPSELFCVGSGNPHSFKTMVNLMHEYAHGGKIIEVDSPGFHERIGIQDFWYDSYKMRRRFNWQPKVDIKEGIKRTIEFYEREGNE
jgi:UDP-glucose 4-epimerase